MSYTCISRTFVSKCCAAASGVGARKGINSWIERNVVLMKDKIHNRVIRFYLGFWEFWYKGIIVLKILVSFIARKCWWRLFVYVFIIFLVYDGILIIYELIQTSSPKILADRISLIIIIRYQISCNFYRSWFWALSYRFYKICHIL